jgi:hypothetical protein
MCGTHYPVPKSKVEAIIAFKILVVHIVVNGCIEPFTKPMPVKSPGEQLIPKMPVHIINRHKNQEGHYMNEVYRYGKSKKVNNA